MNIAFMVLFAVLLNGLILWEGALCHKAGMLSPEQMKAQGIRYGLPFLGHGGMWGDLLLINPVISVLIVVYSLQWGLTDWLSLSTLAVLVVNIFLHITWAQGTQPDCLACRRKLTPAGWVHLLYSSIALIFLSMFYFHTAHIDPSVLITVSVLLAVHLFLGTNKLLDIIRPNWWPRKISDDKFGWFLLVFVWALLAWRVERILAHQ